MKKLLGINVPLTQKVSILSLLALSNLVFSQADPLVAENGVAFGTGNNDPLLRKGATANTSTEDLHLDVANGGAFSIFSDLDIHPTFRAGEGNTGTGQAGKWYRIAQSKKSALNRASAVFHLTEANARHSNVTFRTGMSYNVREYMTFTLLSNSRSNTSSVISEIRYLSNTGNTPSAYNSTFYLEVKLARNATVSYSIMENLAKGGWKPIDWVETTSIPSGYTETKYDISNKLFMVAGETPVLSIDRTTGVAIDGDLTVNGSPVMTASNSPFASGSGLDSFQTGSGTSAVGERSSAFGEWSKAEGTNSFASGSGTFAHGENSTSFGKWSWAGGTNSFVTGAETIAEGENSSSFGEMTWAEGRNSLAIGLGAFAVAKNSFATGFLSFAEGENSTSFGEWTRAGGTNSFVTGSETVAEGDNSTSFGQWSWAAGKNSFASGQGSFAQNEASFAVGRYNESVSEGTYNDSTYPWQGNDLNSVFEIGIGGGSQNRKNAMTVMQDGTIELGKDSVTNEIPLKVKSDGSVILSKAQGDISMGIYGTPAP